MADANVDRRRYRKIYTRIWTNADFRALDAAHKVMALYLLSGPQTNRIGLYRFSVGEAAEDLRISSRTARKRAEFVCFSFNWRFDCTCSVIWIPTWWSWNPPGDKINNFKGALADLYDVPQTPLIALFCNNLLGLSPVAHEVLLERTQSRLCPPQPPDSVGTQEQEQEQEQETVSAEPLRDSVPLQDISPTRLDVPDVGTKGSVRAALRLTQDTSPTTGGGAKGSVRASGSQQDTSPPFAEFPVVGTEGSVWRLTEAQVAEFAKLFPGVDVRQEMRCALAWVIANPGRRKTGRGMLRYLAGWLTRATDRGSRRVLEPMALAPPRLDPARTRYGV
jgi:hypothetical protein